MKKLFLLMLFAMLASSVAHAQNVITISSIAQLRTQPAPKLYPTAYVTQYSATTGIGGGEFSYTGSISCVSVSPTGGDDGGVYIQSVNAASVNTGCWKRNTGGQPFNIAWFGATCGGVQVTDGVINSTTTVTSASAKWGNVKTGWVAVVNGAASAGTQLVTTVTTVNSSSSLTLAASATSSSSGITISVYPDDTTAISQTVTAANAANAAVALPQGATCGLANPNVFNVLTLTGPGLNLNGGNLWLGQTGAVSETGWVIAINSSNSGVWGGTINGLYQTNQNVSQGFSGTLVFNSGSVLPGYTNNFLTNLTITNTKARAFAIQYNSNTVISNVTTENCGDMTYSASYAGMAFCGQIENPQGSLLINNMTADGCSQSCLIVDDLSGGTLDPNYRGTFNNLNFRSANYYALDLETLLGCTVVNNSQIDGTSITPSGNIIGGGVIARNIRCHQQNQIVANTPSNSDIVEDSGGDTPAGNQYVQLNNLKLINSGHSGLLSVTSTIGFATTRFSIDHVITDVLQLSTNSGFACSTSNPMLQYMGLNDVHVSHLYGGTYDTVYSQQGNPSTMYYVQGKDSDLGRVDYTSVGSNPLATDLDFFRVFEQTVTYSGGITRIGRASTSWTNPFSSFSCPT